MLHSSSTTSSQSVFTVLSFGGKLSLPIILFCLLSCDYLFKLILYFPVIFFFHSLFLSPQFVAEVYYARFCVRMLPSKSRSKPGFVFICYPVSLSTEVECEPASNSKVSLSRQPGERQRLGYERKGSYTLSNREKRRSVVARFTERRPSGGKLVTYHRRCPYTPCFKSKDRSRNWKIKVVQVVIDFLGL